MAYFVGLCSMDHCTLALVAVRCRCRCVAGGGGGDCVCWCVCCVLWCVVVCGVLWYVVCCGMCVRVGDVGVHGIVCVFVCVSISVGL